MKDWLGLGKLEKDLNKSLNFDIFPDENKQRVSKKKSNRKHTRREYDPVMTRKQQESTVKAIKTTGSAFKKLVHIIKNRKIRKLEKEAMKAGKKAQALAHEIKTRSAKLDNELDVMRYEQELEKIKAEEKKHKERLAQAQDETNKQTEIAQGCINHPTKFNPQCQKCIEWAEQL